MKSAMVVISDSPRMILAAIVPVASHQDLNVAIDIHGVARNVKLQLQVHHAGQPKNTIVDRLVSVMVEVLNVQNLHLLEMARVVSVVVYVVVENASHSAKLGDCSHVFARPQPMLVNSAVDQLRMAPVCLTI